MPFSTLNTWTVKEFTYYWLALSKKTSVSNLWTLWLHALSCYIALGDTKISVCSCQDFRYTVFPSVAKLVNIYRRWVDCSLNSGCSFHFHNKMAVTGHLETKNSHWFLIFGSAIVVLMECNIMFGLGGAIFHNSWDVNIDHKELEWCFIGDYTKVSE